MSTKKQSIKRETLIPEGKLSIQQLKDLIFEYTKRYSPNRKEILRHPDIGEDCAVIDTKGKMISVSADPITGATEHIGKLAVTINLNDIVSSGAEPLGIMVTLLCPLGTVEQDIAAIMEEVSQIAAENDVEVLGGHTEVTSAVNRIVVSVTAIGLLDPNSKEEVHSPQAGYDIYMTKDVGLEGIYIIGNEKKSELASILRREDYDTIEDYGRSLSVVKDAKLARKYNPALMHDATEGGILGALWEICELTGLGAEIEYEALPLSDTAITICRHFDIDPLRLISSGCLMFVLDPKFRNAVTNDFQKEGIRLSKIGTLTQEPKLLMSQNGIFSEVQPPQSDELYKI